MAGVNSRKSRTERLTSLDWVNYLPTMRIYAPFSSASFAVSETMPPATAMRILLFGKASRICFMRSNRCFFHFLGRCLLCRTTMSGKSFRDLSFARYSSLAYRLQRSFLSVWLPARLSLRFLRELSLLLPLHQQCLHMLCLFRFCLRQVF